MQDFKEIRVFEIGSSVMNKPIFCIRAGAGEKKIFINGAHHGMEYLTSALILRFLRRYAEAVRDKSELYGYDTGFLYSNVTVFAVPMVNPDGVELSVHGLKLKNKYHRHLLKSAGFGRFKNHWQANIRGVDLNHNYDADWRSVKKYPCASKYAGEYPVSEPETRSIVSFSQKEKFDAAIAFHSQGGEIYYDFGGAENPDSKEVARLMAEKSGYSVEHPKGSAGFGGFKDWYIKEFGGLGFTVEIGRGRNPLPIKMLEQVSNENIPLILCLMDYICDKNIGRT